MTWLPIVKGSGEAIAAAANIEVLDPIMSSALLAAVCSKTSVAVAPEPNVIGEPGVRIWFSIMYWSLELAAMV